MSDPVVLLDSLGALAPKLALFVPGAAAGIWLTDRLRPSRPSGDRMRRLIARLTGR
jgi:hypothetical protein